MHPSHPEQQQLALLPAGSQRVVAAPPLRRGPLQQHVVVVDHQPDDARAQPPRAHVPLRDALERVLRVAPGGKVTWSWSGQITGGCVFPPTGAEAETSKRKGCSAR